MNSALFVAHQNVVELIAVIVQRVVHRHDRPAGIAENGVDSFGEQAAQQGIGPRHALSGFGYFFFDFQGSNIHLISFVGNTSLRSRRDRSDIF